jgi:hypothetical protein
MINITANISLTAVRDLAYEPVRGDCSETYITIWIDGMSLRLRFACLLSLPVCFLHPVLGTSSVLTKNTRPQAALQDIAITVQLRKVSQIVDRATHLYLHFASTEHDRRACCVCQMETTSSATKALISVESSLPDSRHSMADEIKAIHDTANPNTPESQLLNRQRQKKGLPVGSGCRSCKRKIFSLALQDIG